EIRSALIAALADGTVHSGADLAHRLSCSRTAIWKHLNVLKSVGLQIEAQRGIGYQLRQPLELLDEAVIRHGLDARTSAALNRLELHDDIESTSERLRELPAPAADHFDAVLAEYQANGRGRRGRQWLSPFGSGLCFSVNRWFEMVPAALPALSLAVGVGVCRVLRDHVTHSVGLKWPNDIVTDSGKLGGLLIDVQGEADGPIVIVIGIGLNFDVSAAMVEQVAQAGGLAPVGLRDFAEDSGLSRNLLAALLINELHTVLTEFERSGFDTFADEWRRYDWLADRPVTAQIGPRSVSGTARGITNDGALLIDSKGELQHLVSGEISLRPDCAG
ncbi:MAG: biotin--[acetyl-CoA-carboxylase] ligase, partial [Gammaproteobacteria bacterium]|nr:biotin--[acetyl-CoA-carboxylase] ligase [Gammaproteobacteria bacterium]